MKVIEFLIVREPTQLPQNGKEGFTKGRIFCGKTPYGYTVEDQDRRLEEGAEKIYGKTAMPLGRYKMSLYHSPKHGIVPLFHDVPGFTYTEIHRANHAEELLGCVAVGKVPTEDGVAQCQIVLDRIVATMQSAEDEGAEVYCTITRKEQ